VPDLQLARRTRLRATALHTAGADVDAVLVTRLVNVRYLAGFTGSNAALLLTGDRTLLATDGRYTLQAGAESPDVELVTERRCAQALAERAARLGVRRLAIETHDVTVDLHGQFVEAAGEVDLVSLDGAVERLRAVKDETEIALLREACAVTDRAFTALAAEMCPGLTEREIAWRLEVALRDAGADGPAFDPIVAGGPNGAVPHHQATGRALEPGDLLTLDFGARHAGYHADMTRTVMVGGRPAGWQQEIYALVAAAQQAGRDAAVHGSTLRAVDRAAREVIEQAGHGEHFVHPVGHGVGLQIHEAPLLGPGTDGRLADRSPVTVEPGVYLPGRGGVRIEDTLVVRAGAPELLTTTTRDLLVL
jgi:Xaa-Pro aminopeptidase